MEAVLQQSALLERMAREEKERISTDKQIEKNKKDKMYVKIVALKKEEKGKDIVWAANGVNYQVKDGAEGWLSRQAVEALRDARAPEHKIDANNKKTTIFHDSYMVVEIQPKEEKEEDKIKKELLK